MGCYSSEGPAKRVYLAEIGVPGHVGTNGISGQEKLLVRTFS